MCFSTCVGHVADKQARQRFESDQPDTPLFCSVANDLSVTTLACPSALPAVSELQRPTSPDVRKCVPAWEMFSGRCFAICPGPKPSQALRLRVCAGCREVRYCSRQCQLEHLKMHREVCKHMSVLHEMRREVLNSTRPRIALLVYMACRFQFCSLCNDVRVANDSMLCHVCETPCTAIPEAIEYLATNGSSQSSCDDTFPYHYLDPHLSPKMRWRYNLQFNAVPVKSQRGGIQYIAYSLDFELLRGDEDSELDFHFR